jgi:CDP-glucose 4,6-dehydratase
VRWIVERWGVPMVAGVAEHPETPVLRVDSTKARTRLGWRPALDLAAALDATIAAYRASDARATALEQIAQVPPIPCRR